MQLKSSVHSEVRHPRPGMLAAVRNRRAVIASVEPYDGPEGRLHVVRVEYADGGSHVEDTLIWEREDGATVLPPHALPRVEADQAMPADEFQALVRSARWTAMAPFLAPTGTGERIDEQIAAPFFGAVQAEDFQLVPLLKALQMSRVSLLLADDVGLGKTIEAGLVLTELLLRRRIRRVLVLCPAALKNQWREEMQRKFSLDFDAVDRDETYQLQKRLGLDANPWRTFPRIIASYHYLRQADVLESFLTTCRISGKARLPWDLLIVDEVHNLMPNAFGEDSQLTAMLRTISPYFEHRIFLTATPHNGHTRSWSGLLELLDPVRFTRKSEYTDAERSRAAEVTIRRLKKEINQLDDGLGRPRRFAVRHPHPLPLYFRKEEIELAQAVERFRIRVRAAIVFGGDAERRAGAFAAEVLAKRLLSGPATFAQSWNRLKEGLAADQESATTTEVNAARRAAEEDIEDDREREGRTHLAVRTIGAWLVPLAGALAYEIAAIDTALNKLHAVVAAGTIPTPKFDARFDRICALIEEQLRRDEAWVDDERLIVFTEYKTSLDYLALRLRSKYNDDGRRIRVLYGGAASEQHSRESIIQAFNDPADPVRVLVATDVASEGLNLQETARLVLHWDVPWNPSRLEQRNGRLDRHGQARDVTVYHFTSEDFADLRFMAHVVNKVEEIREDLGSVGEIFDAAFQRRFVRIEDEHTVRDDLDQGIELARGRAVVPRDDTTDGIEQVRKLAALGCDLDLSPETLRDTLDVALAMGGAGRPRLEGPDANGRMRLRHPLPHRWEDIIDDTLRMRDRSNALPSLVFDPRCFIEMAGQRPVFRPAKDAVLLHLGHPLFQRALAALARARFSAAKNQIRASRWTATRGELPSGADALVLVTVEELAINELREPVHHWVRTWRLPVNAAGLGLPLSYIAPGDEKPEPGSSETVRIAREVWENIRPEVESFVRGRSKDLTQQIVQQFRAARADAQSTEAARFKIRIEEIEQERRLTTIARLERELEEAELASRQMHLLEEVNRARTDRLRVLQEEHDRRVRLSDDLIDVIRAEQRRVLDEVLPRRFQLHGEAQVFPIALEIRVPR